MEPKTITLRIFGKPIAKGRPRSVQLIRYGKPVLDDKGRPVIKVYTPKNTRQWKKEILSQVQHLAPKKPLSGPIRCDREYIFQPPKKPKHPKWHIITPDLDNLDKALWDSLQGLFFEDDKQICLGSHLKRYAKYGEEEGVFVRFTLLEV